jgi:hypothetical protein
MKKNWIKTLTISLSSLGLLSITLFSITAFGIPFQGSNINYFLATFSILILTSISSFIIGAGMGFLFGVPKRNDEQKEEKSKYIPNTNLEQVSDWLTKILIGIGLTQVNRISNKFHAVSKEIASGLTAISDSSETIFVGSTIVYFLVSGFLISYLLTRLRLNRIFEESEA